jgi:hypothetical protein
MFLTLFKKIAEIIWVITKYNFRSKNPVNFLLADFCQETNDETDMNKREKIDHFLHRFGFDIRSELRAILIENI